MLSCHSNHNTLCLSSYIHSMQPTGPTQPHKPSMRHTYAQKSSNNNQQLKLMMLSHIQIQMRSSDRSSIACRIHTVVGGDHLAFCVVFSADVLVGLCILRRSLQEPLVQQIIHLPA